MLQLHVVTRARALCTRARSASNGLTRHRDICCAVTREQANEVSSRYNVKWRCVEANVFPLCFPVWVSQSGRVCSPEAPPGAGTHWTGWS